MVRLCRFVLLGLLAGLLPLPAAAQAGVVEGTVRESDGTPVRDAIVYLHRAHRGGLTGADGKFFVEAESGDVLVVSKSGYADAIHYVDPSRPGPVEVLLDPIPGRVREPRIVEDRTRFTLVAVQGEFTLSPEGRRRAFHFEADPGLTGGDAFVYWGDDDVVLRTLLSARGGGPLLGEFAGRPPLLLPLPAALIRDRPGSYEISVEVIDGSAAALEVGARIELRYGPWTSKVVHGRPPEVGDPADLDPERAPVDLDLRSATFTNETDDGFDVVLEVAELTAGSLFARPREIVWRVEWTGSGARRFVALAGGSDVDPSAPHSARFYLGACDPRCAADYLIPGRAEIGSPGRLVFHVPKALVGSPRDGEVLQAPRATSFYRPATDGCSSFCGDRATDPALPSRSEEDRPLLASGVAPLHRRVPARVELGHSAFQVDSTEIGRMYRLGAHEFALSPPLFDQIRASTVRPALPSSPWAAGGSATIAFLLVLGAVGAGVGALAGETRRRRAERESGPPSRYEKVRPVGPGPDGTHLARDGRLGKLVLVREAATAAPLGADLKREARLLARVRDPHVVEVLDLEERGDRVALVTEYADGGSLADRLAPGVPLPRAEALGIWRDVLAGLAALHEAGIPHGDLSPASVVLTRSGQAKVTGLGSGSGSATARQRRPSAPRAPAHVLFAAPERLAGAGPSPASDLYSATALAHLLLTGRAPVPLHAVGSPERLAPALAARRAALERAGWAAPIRDLLREGLSVDPEGRGGDARAHLARLAEAFASLQPPGEDRPPLRG